jgi:hypothetical protein
MGLSRKKIFNPLESSQSELPICRKDFDSPFKFEPAKFYCICIIIESLIMQIFFLRKSLIILERKSEIFLKVALNTIPLSLTLDLQLLEQSVHITTKVVSSNPIHSDVYSIQHCVKKFVSDLGQIGGFLRVFWFPPRIGFELTTLVVIGTDCTDSYKSTYHAITTTTASHKMCQMFS